MVMDIKGLVPESQLDSLELAHAASKVSEAAVAYCKLRNGGCPYSPVGSASKEGKALADAVAEYTRLASMFGKVVSDE